MKTGKTSSAKAKPQKIVKANQGKLNVADWLEKIARPEIWRMVGYSSARSEMADFAGMVQLDANENPFIPYPESHEVSKVNRYPEPQPNNLLTRLAAMYGAKVDQVLVARGMDEVIDLLVRVFCIPYQDSIVITPPTFGYYQVAADIAGADVIKVSLNEVNNFTLNADELISSCHPQVKIVFLCTPNNPTGNVIPLVDIEKIAKALPQTIIAVDEAYLEFADTASAITLMPKYANLVVMKTLSKAYAFAGVRVGTLVADNEIIKLVSKVLPPYPLPEPCIRLAVQALSPFGLALAHDRIEMLKRERERMFKFLSKIAGVHAYVSQANFILLKVDDASKIYQNLLAKGIIIRNRSKDIVNTLRISIGKPEENDLVLTAFGVKFKHKTRMERTATVVRKTNETDIMLQINLDKQMPININTGIGFFDHMLDQLAKHGGFSLQVAAIGDTHIDFHHTVEDVAIVLGQALKQALGSKLGLQRYGFVLPMDEACAFATIDLSGRGVLVLEADFPTPMIGDFPVEMVRHFFLSLSQQLGAAIHLSVSGENSHHMVEGLFKACAKALGQAITQTQHNSLPSTKGML